MDRSIDYICFDSLTRIFDISVQVLCMISFEYKKKKQEKNTLRLSNYRFTKIFNNLLTYEERHIYEDQI